MEQTAAAVWIVVMAMSLLGHSGDVRPLDKQYRGAYAVEDTCVKAARRLEIMLKRKPPPLMPDKVFCERLEIVK